MVGWLKRSQKACHLISAKHRRDVKTENICMSHFYYNMYDLFYYSGWGIILYFLIEPTVHSEPVVCSIDTD